MNRVVLIRYRCYHNLPIDKRASQTCWPQQSMIYLYHGDANDFALDDYHHACRDIGRRNITARAPSGNCKANAQHNDQEVEAGDLHIPFNQNQLATRQITGCARASPPAECDFPSGQATGKIRVLIRTVCFGVNWSWSTCDHVWSNANYIIDAPKTALNWALLNLSAFSRADSTISLLSWRDVLRSSPLVGPFWFLLSDVDIAVNCCCSSLKAHAH